MAILLLFDFGATYGGYCADITRVVFIGEVDCQAQREFYAVVEAANASGEIGIAGPGVLS